MSNRYEVEQCGDGDTLCIIDNEIKPFSLKSKIIGETSTSDGMSIEWVPSNIASEFEICNLLNEYNSIKKVQMECKQPQSTW